MSPTQSPPSSSVVGGPPSSPFTGTEHTGYSPDAARKGDRQVVAESSKAAGKKPVVDVVPIIRHTIYDGLDPRPHDHPVFVNEIDASSKDFISRYFFVKRMPDGASTIEAGSDHEAELNKVQEKMKEYLVFRDCVPIYSRGIFLRYDNLQDAGAGKLILEQHQFACAYVDNYAFALAKSQDTAAIDEFEGQLRIVVSASPVIPALQIKFTLNDLRLMHDDLEAALSRFGAIRDFVNVSNEELALEFVFRFEFYSVEAANRARASLLDEPMERQCDNGLWLWTVHSADNWTGPRPPNSPHRHNPRKDDQGRLVDFRHTEVNIPAQPVNQPNDPQLLHNRVDKSRIESGADVRTTIMLRNIPNKLDWMTLKALLDRICFGTYDFIYLRIDFKSGHNVGYAFINFCDIQGMLLMLKHVEGRGWPGYRSTKNAELSYATIQGREALVQKFRNSSVMQQTPYCRPRLFVTKEEAWIIQNIRKTGVELKFPDPDNWSKYQRSIDSARTVGLFAPTGAVHQAADRTHSSAYDRGTPRDMVHMYNQYGNPPNFTVYTDAQKREAEVKYFDQFGPSQSGMIAFENIPLLIVKGYIGTPQAGHGLPVNPGPIQRPVPRGLGPAQGPIPLYGFGNATYTATDANLPHIFYTGGHITKKQE